VLPVGLAAWRESFALKEEPKAEQPAAGEEAEGEAAPPGEPAE